MWLGGLGCADPLSDARDGYHGARKPYGFDPPRASSPMPHRSPLGDAVADGRLQRAGHDDPRRAFDHAMEENRWMANEMNEAPHWARPWQAETQRLRQEIFDLQIAEHGAALRAQLHEQQVWAEARAAEHAACMKASQGFQNIEQQAALQVQQAMQQEAMRASDMERRYAAKLAISSGQVAAAQANASARQAEVPRLEAQAAAHAQRLINAKMLEADKRTSEAAAARDTCERLVLKQLSELQEASAVNGELASSRDQVKHHLQNTEEANSKLSRRLRTTEEANQELIARLRDSEEARNQLMARVRAADPALAAQLTGEDVDPGAPQRTAMELEAENIDLRANLLEVTEQLEELSESHQENAMRLQSARAKIPRNPSKASSRGASPRLRADSMSPRGGPPSRSLSPRAGPALWAAARTGVARMARPDAPLGRAGSPRHNNSARMASARTAASSGGLQSARSFSSANGAMGGDRRGSHIAR